MSSTFRLGSYSPPCRPWDGLWAYFGRWCSCFWWFDQHLCHVWSVSGIFTRYLEVGDYVKYLGNWVVEVQYSSQALSSLQELESFVDLREWQVVRYELLHIDFLHMITTTCSSEGKPAFHKDHIVEVTFCCSHKIKMTVLSCYNMPRLEFQFSYKWCHYTAFAKDLMWYGK